MIKLIYCINRKPDLTDEQFFDYWKNVHGPIGARIPGLRRLVQSRRVNVAGDKPADFDGVAELWFDDEPALLAARESSEWKASSADEANFIDHKRVAYLVTEEHVIRERQFKATIPLLHVANAAAARQFYCDGLGFRLAFAHGPDETLADPCYMGLERDGAWLIASSFPGDGVAGGVCNVMVSNVDALHAEFLAKGVKIDLAPVNQTWGTREMYVRDADRNTVRFIQE